MLHRGLAALFIGLSGLAVGAFAARGRDRSPAPPRDPVQRMREIVGRPPRIAPLCETEISEEARAISAQLGRAAGVEGGDRRHAPPEIVATLLKHPRLYEKDLGLGLELLGRPIIAPRDRELAVLRSAWLLGAPFEWGEHVLIGKRAGLTSAEIERITQGSAASGWSPRDRAVLRAAEELRADAMIGDETWRELAAYLDEAQLIELTCVIGVYTKVAYMQNALRLRLTPSNPGLSAR